MKMISVDEVRAMLENASKNLTKAVNNDALLADHLDKMFNIGVDRMRLTMLCELTEYELRTMKEVS